LGQVKIWPAPGAYLLNAAPYQRSDVASPIGPHSPVRPLEPPLRSILREAHTWTATPASRCRDTIHASLGVGHRVMHVHQLATSASAVDSDELWWTDGCTVATDTWPRSRRFNCVFALRSWWDLHEPTLVRHRILRRSFCASRCEATRVLAGDATCQVTRASAASGHKAIRNRPRVVARKSHHRPWLAVAQGRGPTGAGTEYSPNADVYGPFRPSPGRPTSARPVLNKALAEHEIERRSSSRQVTTERRN
jgi:hypothetical protein